MSNFENFDERMSVSPSTSTQWPDNSTPVSNMPNSVRTFCSKIISSCKKVEKMSCTVTPENKYRRTSSPFLKRKAFNPFNRNLKERLENPIFSPNVFSTVISPSQDSEVFKWTIDDLSKINPAQIEEDVHYDEQIDEQTEKEMQNSIDRYFTKTHMPSPWSVRLPTCWDNLREIFKAEGTVCSNEGDENMSISPSSPISFSLSRLELVSKDSLNLSNDASTQTALSLPPDLPDSINNALKPYFSENNADDINLSLNSLRRKLFFQQEDEKKSSPIRFCSSPNGSPMVNKCYPSTPMFNNRTEDSPVEKLSTPDLSPIGPCEKTYHYSNNKTEARTPLRAVENNEYRSTKLEETPKTKRFSQECSKIFESPKLTGNLRRNRKRRRSFSSDMNMSVSYSTFLAKQKISVSKRSFGESRMLCDTSNDVFAVSQDTGYQTESANYQTFGVEKNYPNHSLNIRSLALECWQNADKENHRVESTPTH